MRFLRTLIVIVAIIGFAPGLPAQSVTPAPVPKIDKQKLEAYLRYAEGFPPSVKLVADDPIGSPLAGYYRVLVHLSRGETKQEKTYYLTADGQHVTSGPVWDLNGNPFSQALAQLPKDGPSFGPPDASIALVVFSDFQCPYCREFARTLRDNIPQKYPKDVRVIFKDFPIPSLHPWATAAAEASHCVGDGKSEAFWQYHDWIFQHQGEISSSNVREKSMTFAKERGLDPAVVGTCIDSHAKKEQIDRTVAEGRKLGIDQTPTFFLNGRVVPGAVPWQALETLIQMELNRPTFIPEAKPGEKPLPQKTQAREDPPRS